MLKKQFAELEEKLNTLDEGVSRQLTEAADALRLIGEELRETRQENQQIKEQLTDLEKLVTKRMNRVDKNAKALTAGVEEAEKTAKDAGRLSKRILSEMARHAILSRRGPRRPIRGSVALAQLIDNYTFQTVLDVGCGEGLHAEAFLKAGKTVTAIDYGKSEYFSKRHASLQAIVADFNTYAFEEPFDCVWCSHVLEHQLNVNVFLKKCFSILKDGGVLSISVPPAKAAVVSGHVTLWNPGLLCYNLILAGFDCSEAVVEIYDYDISVTVRKKHVPKEVLRGITFDVGDLGNLRDYFPADIQWNREKNDISFDGELFGLWEEPSVKAPAETKPAPLHRWIEVTTKVGCSVRCAYCPQDAFINAYTQGNQAPELMLSLENFKKALAHIPLWLDVCFCGFAEPFENPHAFQMLEYAVKKGYQTHVYSTLKALSLVEIDRLRDLNVKSYVIHIPDEDGMMHLKIDDEYLQKLELFVTLALPNVKYVCIGKPSGLIPGEIAERIKKEKIVTFRAGNLKENEQMSPILGYHPNCGRIIASNQRVVCNHRLHYKGADRRATHPEAVVMLPDGRVTLCCMDFGMRHVLGNLLEEDYESMMYGGVMKSVEDAMMCKNREEILCRSCELALEYDEEKWAGFLMTGKYDKS